MTGQRAIRGVVGAGVVAAFLAAGCATAGSPSAASRPAAAAPHQRPPRHRGSGPPRRAGWGGTQPGKSSGIDYGSLAAYKKRCEKIDTSGAWAHVVYKPNVRMTRGDSTMVTAAVTVDYTLPPAEVLPGPGSVSSPRKTLVSCIVEAQLSGSSWDFNIDNTRWVQGSFYTADTVSWSWYVGPKLGGTHILTLRVKPFVDRAQAGSVPTASGSDVVPFFIRAHVNVPWREFPAVVMSSLAANFKVAQGLIESLTGLILALGGLGTALHIKRRRARRRTVAARPPTSRPRVPDRV